MVTAAAAPHASDKAIRTANSLSVISLYEFLRPCCPARNCALLGQMAAASAADEVASASPAIAMNGAALVGARSFGLVTPALCRDRRRILRRCFGHDLVRHRGNVAEPGEYSRGAPPGVREARPSTVRRHRSPPPQTPEIQPRHSSPVSIRAALLGVRQFDQQRRIASISEDARQADCRRLSRRRFQSKRG